MEINQEKCVGCKSCVAACPMSAISVEQTTNKPEINQEMCVSCGCCVKACPMSAINDNTVVTK